MSNISIAIVLILLAVFLQVSVNLFYGYSSSRSPLFFSQVFAIDNSQSTGDDGGNVSSTVEGLDVRGIEPDQAKRKGESMTQKPGFP